MAWLKKMLLAMLMAFVTVPVAASELKLLVDMLRDNGMVSDEQYQRLLAELNQNQQQKITDLETLKAELVFVKQQAAASEAQLQLLKAQAARDQIQLAEIKQQADSGVDVMTRGGITVKSRDGEFETRLRGRLMVDAAILAVHRRTIE